MYLYLDLIWLLNFAIDYLLLWLTAHIGRKAYKRWRLVLASAVGSSYILILFFPPLAEFYSFLTKCLLSVVIVYVAFGFGTVQQFIRSFFTFCFVSFLTGGGLLAIHYMLNSQYQVMQGIVATQSSGYGDPVSWLFVLIGFPLLFWFSQRQWHQNERINLTSQILADVELYFDQSKVILKGIIDTGNKLYHPLNMKPVIVVEERSLKFVVPSHVLQALSRMDEWGKEEWAIDEKWLARVSFIPYRSVGQKGAILPTLTPDEVVVRFGQHAVRTDQVLVGVSPMPLSINGQFQAVIHPDLLQDGFKKQIEQGEALQC